MFFIIMNYNNMFATHFLSNIYGFFILLCGVVNPCVQEHEHLNLLYSLQCPLIEFSSFTFSKYYKNKLYVAISKV